MTASNKGRRVLVAMSGGVDSSLAAALLVDAGYDVIGATMQIWAPDLPYAEGDVSGGCCSLSAVDDARSVADRLNIPYYVLNFYELFSAEVVDDFARKYEAGMTPNPCLVCNGIVKFKAFLDKALALDAQYIATGHYARVAWSPSLGRYMLSRAVDQVKDQSYALYMLTQFSLAHTLFPLGGLTKGEVRRMAKAMNLTVADKPDSQEICFIPDGDYRRFLREYTPKASIPGDIVDEAGNRLGTHTGIGSYTVGQRKGLGPSIGEGLYVKRIDAEANTVVVAPAHRIYSRSMKITDVNTILYPAIEPGLRVKVKVRYSAPASDAVLSPLENGCVRVDFDEPVRAITPGQAAVFYQGDAVVGGGTISREL